MARPRFRGDRLRAAREAAGLTRKDLTLALGLSSPLRISQWEREFERPQPRYVPALAAALNVEPLHLLDVDPQDPPLAAIRIAAGKNITEMRADGMSFMTYQRIEDARPGVDISESVIAVIGDLLTIDRASVDAAVRRTVKDRDRHQIK